MTPPYCARLRERFDDYHDHELSPFLSRVIRRHLECCPPCRSEYGLFEGALQTLRRFQAPDVPPQLLRKLVEDLSKPGGGIPFSPPLEGPDLVGGLESL